MTAVETIATAEDESHLVLEKPLDRMPNGPVKIIVMLEEDLKPKRILGHMEGRASCRIGADFVMSDKELLET